MSGNSNCECPIKNFQFSELKNKTQNPMFQFQNFQSTNIKKMANFKTLGTHTFQQVHIFLYSRDVKHIFQGCSFVFLVLFDVFR